MSAPAIHIEDANLEYEHHLLLKNFNLSLAGGHCTCLLGPSGVGKTSLLRLIAGLKSSATSHCIKTSDQLPLKGRISYLAQNETLLPWKTAFENVLIGPILRGQQLNNALLTQGLDFIHKVGLTHYKDHYPDQLSGGMRQRILLARTLFEDSPVILMDEPFAALDVITRTSIQELSAILLKDKTVLLVTHDPLEALRLGHHVYVMSGTPATITTKIELPGETPRDLLDVELMKTQAHLLDMLSHAKEVMK